MAATKPPSDTPQAPTATQEPVTLDLLDPQELQRRVALTREHLAAIHELWAGLKPPDEAQHGGSKARVLLALGEPLRALFGLLQSPHPTHEAFDALTPDEQKRVTDLEGLRLAFNALADEDGGVDPETFEVGLLSRRLELLGDLQTLSEGLSRASRILGGELLREGDGLFGPSLAALDFGKALARNSKAFRALLAPMTDALNALSRPSR